MVYQIGIGNGKLERINSTYPYQFGNTIHTPKEFLRGQERQHYRLLLPSSIPPVLSIIADEGDVESDL